MSALGHRDTGGHKNKGSRDRIGHIGHAFGPMAGEISPNIMFCDDREKMAQMDADGYKWMQMGAIGCMGKGTTQNNTDRAKM